MDASVIHFWRTGNLDWIHWLGGAPRGPLSHPDVSSGTQAAFTSSQLLQNLNFGTDNGECSCNDLLKSPRLKIPHAIL